MSRGRVVDAVAATAAGTVVIVVSATTAFAPSVAIVVLSWLALSMVASLVWDLTVDICRLANRESRR